MGVRFRVELTRARILVAQVPHVERPVLDELPLVSAVDVPFDVGLGRGAVDLGGVLEPLDVRKERADAEAARLRVVEFQLQRWLLRSLGNSAILVLAVQSYLARERTRRR